MWWFIITTTSAVIPILFPPLPHDDDDILPPASPDILLGVKPASYFWTDQRGNKSIHFPLTVANPRTPGEAMYCEALFDTGAMTDVINVDLAKKIHMDLKPEPRASAKMADGKQMDIQFTGDAVLRFGENPNPMPVNMAVGTLTYDMIIGLNTASRMFWNHDPGKDTLFNWGGLRVPTITRRAGEVRNFRNLPLVGPARTPAGALEVPVGLATPDGTYLVSQQANAEGLRLDEFWWARNRTSIEDELIAAEECGVDDLQSYDDLVEPVFIVPLTRDAEIGVRRLPLLLLTSNLVRVTLSVSWQKLVGLTRLYLLSRMKCYMHPMLRRAYQQFSDDYFSSLEAKRDARGCELVMMSERGAMQMLHEVVFLDRVRRSFEDARQRSVFQSSREIWDALMERRRELTEVNEKGSDWRDLRRYIRNLLRFDLGMDV